MMAWYDVGTPEHKQWVREYHYANRVRYAAYKSSKSKRIAGRLRKRR